MTARSIDDLLALRNVTSVRFQCPTSVLDDMFAHLADQRAEIEQLTRDCNDYRVLADRRNADAIEAHARIEKLEAALREISAGDQVSIWRTGDPVPIAEQASSRLYDVWAKAVSTARAALGED